MYDLVINRIDDLVMAGYIIFNINAITTTYMISTAMHILQ